MRPDGHGLADRTIWDHFLGATGLRDVCDVTECDDHPDSIDKIAFRSNHHVKLRPHNRVIPDAAFTRDDGVPLSDHSPVAVTFTWKRRAR